MLTTAIANLIVELSKETETEDPVTAIYSIYKEVSREVGKRMKEEAQRDER